MNQKQHIMQQRIMTMTGVLFSLIVLGMFIFAYLTQQERQVTTPKSAVVEIQTDSYAYIESVAIHQTYAAGVYTIVGELALPTPCDVLTLETFVAESYPEQVQLAFTATNPAEYCAQTITPQRFSAEVAVSKEASFAATFNTRPIELTATQSQPLNQ